MKLSKNTFLFLLVATLTTAKVYAEETPTIDQNLSQAYLSYWFSFDPSEPIDLKLTPLKKDIIGERNELRFTSDDGQSVNGLIAFPEDKAASKKLALALHPMGTGQQFWWDDKSPLNTQKLTASLREQGYTVISLDARQHGERGREGFGPRELLKRARSARPRLYIDTIIGSVRDYRIILNWASKKFNPSEVLVMGYSMGAQMSLLLASYEPSIDSILAMVPPYVDTLTSPVAPRVHVKRITTARTLWLAGGDDPHSERNQTQATFDKISSADKTLTWFESGHRLPAEFLDSALSFFDSLNEEKTQ